jgi:DNA-binding FadR family transcriptional regulator
MTDPNAAQRAILDALFQAHPRMLGIDDLAAQLTEVSRVREALRVLVDDGLVTQLGELVGVSRAAVRFQALRSVS